MRKTFPPRPLSSVCLIRIVLTFQARGLLRTGQRSQDEARGRGLHGNQQQQQQQWTPVSVFPRRRQHMQELLPDGKTPQVCNLHFYPTFDKSHEHAITTATQTRIIVFFCRWYSEWPRSVICVCVCVCMWGQVPSGKCLETAWWIMLMGSRSHRALFQVWDAARHGDPLRPGRWLCRGAVQTQAGSRHGQD